MPEQINIDVARLSACSVQDDLRILAHGEVERADRYKLTVHRSRFVAGRAFLRRTLAAFMQMDPTQVRFDIEPGGRPFLFHPHAPTFSFSQSGDMALVATAQTGPIGADIERIRNLSDVDLLAASVMHPDDWTNFRLLPPCSRLRAFFLHWTRKEAFLKAKGTGFAIDPRRTSVGVEGGGVGPQPLSISGLQCHIRDLTIADGYAVAVCAPTVVSCSIIGDSVPIAKQG